MGLCARRLDAALRKLASHDIGLSVESWTRRSPRPSDVAGLQEDSPELLARLRKLSLLNSWRGVGGIYHSVDPILSPLKTSKRVMTVHDCWTLRENPYQSPQFQRQQKKKFERALGRADHVVLPSRHVLDQLVALRPEFSQRATVIPWGPLMDHEGESNPEPPAIPSVVDAYLSKGRPFFLCVANLETRKNHEILFQAMESLPHVDLVLVGAKGWGWEAVEKRRQELCRTTPCFWFQGLSVREMRALYHHAMTVVLPSLDEGFGLPACEAMFFDKPLVLSKIPPFIEIAGSSALYFDPVAGVSELREILSSLARDTALRASWASKLLSRKHIFSWELTARAHLALYRRLMSLG